MDQERDPLSGPFRITFERIGRRRDVAPLTVDYARDPTQLADWILGYARPYLVSEYVEVVVDMRTPDDMKGHIQVGAVHCGGRFTIERITVAGGTS